MVAVPEQCDGVSVGRIDNAVSRAVGWFANNQRDDGQWLYRYDTATGKDLGGYNWVRHAGVLLSLEQAASRGTTDVAATARTVADKGWAAILKKNRSVDIDGVATTAMAGSGGVTGGTALTGIALSERRLRTSDTGLDAPLLSYARFAAAQVQADGRVLNDVDLDTGTGRPGTYSPFATGQVLFLMARTRAITGTTEFDGKIRAILHYLATDRARVEGYVPEISDHWTAYAFAVLESDEPSFLSDQRTIAFVRKQLGVAAVQVRYESQRTDSHLNRWTRGRQTVAAGLGTLGEAIGNWQQVVIDQPALRSQQGWLHQRLSCVAELLVDRQTASTGAWTQFGITQMDDQQHAISALLAARDVALDSPNVPRRVPVPENALLVVVLAVLVLNPPRLTRRAASCNGIRTGILATGMLGLLAAVGGPIVRALNVSEATAVVGAGTALVVATAAAVLRRTISDDATSDTQLLLEGYLRPETILLAIALGAGGQGWVWAVTVAFVVITSTLLGRRYASIPPTVHAWLVRLSSVALVVAGIALIVDGAYAV